MVFSSILILIVAIALPSINTQLTSYGAVLFTRITSIVFIYSGVLAYNALYIQSIGSGIGIYSGLLHVTCISQLFDIFILLIASLILIGWPLLSKSLPLISITDIKNTSTYLTLINYFNKTANFILKEDIKSNTHDNMVIDRSHYPVEYSLIILFSTLGASLLISSGDLISMYLSIELQSFGVYILATLYRDSESSTSAGLKYFLLGALSSCFILLGSGLIYSYTGLTNFESIYNLLLMCNNTPVNQGLSIGFILIFAGFLFKIAASPLHNWAPDVYEDTPNIVTIWLTIMPKISIIILLLELYTQIGLIDVYFVNILDIFNIVKLNNISVTLQYLLLISSLLSLIIGTVVGLAQTRIKRLLAYSTISHIGFLMLALAINSEQSIESLLFYIIQYSITNLNTFLIILALGYIIKKNWDIKTLSYFNYFKGFESDLKFLSELRGQFFANPLLSISLSICLFSMAGIPPLIGFFSKQFVLYSAVQNGYYFMSFVGIIVSIISASYYLKIIKLLHMESEGVISDTNLLVPVKSSETIKNNNNTLSSEAALSEIDTHSNSTEIKLIDYSDSYISNLHSFIISSLTLTILLFVLKPSILLNSTRVLSLSIFNS